MRMSVSNVGERDAFEINTKIVVLLTLAMWSAITVIPMTKCATVDVCRHRRVKV